MNPLFVGIDVSSRNNVAYLMKPDGSKYSSFSVQNNLGGAMGTPQHIPAHINPGFVFLGNAVIQKQRQIQERADRGKARLISKTAVVGRQFHINIRLAAPCSGQVR